MILYYAILCPTIIFIRNKKDNQSLIIFWHLLPCMCWMVCGIILVYFAYTPTLWILDETPPHYKSSILLHNDGVLNDYVQNKAVCNKILKITRQKRVKQLEKYNFIYFSNCAILCTNSRVLTTWNYRSV